jgi:hypothetical protein
MHAWGFIAATSTKLIVWSVGNRFVGDRLKGAPACAGRDGRTNLKLLLDVGPPLSALFRPNRCVRVAVVAEDVPLKNGAVMAIRSFHFSVEATVYPVLSSAALPN